MFEKIVSVLPYNPGLAPQLAFYSRRMREEASIRRIGVVFMVLTFMVQFFAVFSPPQSTSASSSNDLINGRVSSIADARAQCVRDTQGYQKILHHFGISCAAFDDASKVSGGINATGQDYYSAGHNPSAGADTPFNIPGASTIYFRKLSTFGKVNYEAMRLKNQDGKTFYVLYDCGNLVTVGLPKPSPLSTPAPPTSNLPTYTPTTPPKTPPKTPTPPPTKTPTQPTPTTPTPETPPPATPQYCTGPGIPANTPVGSPLCTPTNTPQYCTGPGVPANTPIGSPMCKPCPYNSNFAVGSPECKPCDKSVSTADTLACVAVHKTAVNVTTGNSDANNTTVKPGDVITYTLYAQNNGKEDVKEYTFTENLNDVLDYADVTDLYGGTKDATNNVTWPSEKIKAGATATRQVTVKVKAEIPQTPTGTSDPMHFDLTLTNVYGNAVNIKVPPSLAKTVQVAAATLPNTGPGTTLFIAASIVILAGYFYGRARLLAQESDMAIKDTASV